MAARWTLTEGGTVATRIDGIVVRLLTEKPDPTHPKVTMPAGIGIALPEHPEEKYHNGSPWYIQPKGIKHFRALVESQGIWFPLAEGTLDEWRERVHALLPLREFPRVLVREYIGLDVESIEKCRNEGWRILHIAPYLAASGRYDVLVEKDGKQAPHTNEPPYVNVRA